MYRAASIPIIIVDAIAKAGELLNIAASIMTGLDLCVRFTVARLIMIISAMRMIKTRVIRSIKGRSGKEPFVQAGRNLSTVERGMVKIAEVNAAAEVARLQKKPKRKIDRTPGDIKPTYSCMNWYACSSERSAGATTAAISIAMITVHLPVRMSFFSDASGWKYFL